MANLTPAQKWVQLQESLEEERMKEERMQDVLLLLEHLVEREEATVKIILDCLYDVGSANLRNKWIRSRSLDGLTKAIAKRSKPVFRLVAMRWFKKNAPQLITNWLQGKVSF
jgi:hypothetical protein